MNNDLLEAIFQKGGNASERLGVYGSLLELACHFGNYEKMNLLLDAGAQLDAGIGQFGTATQAAAIGGHDQIMSRLLDEGEDPNSKGVWLGKNENVGVRGLEAYGACVWLQQGEGFIAYDHSFVTSGFYAPALHAALRLREDDHNKIFVLFEHEPTHSRGHLGNPLQAAAYRGHLNVMKVLIQRGADVNRTGGFFGTPLQAASSQAQLTAVKLLLESGADPNAVSSGHYGTALNAAIALRRDDMIDLLERYGAIRTTSDEDGWDTYAWSTLNGQKVEAHQLSKQVCSKIKRPAAWSSTERSAQLSFDQTGLEAEFPVGPNVQEDGDQVLLAATVIADHPVSPYRDFYFEVTILSEGLNQ